MEALYEQHASAWERSAGKTAGKEDVSLGCPCNFCKLYRMMEDRVGKLKERLQAARKHLKHGNGCEWDNGLVCDCGLQDFLKTIDSVLEDGV